MVFGQIPILKGGGRSMCYIFHKGDFLPHKSIVGYKALRSWALPSQLASGICVVTGLDLLAEAVQLYNQRAE